jgi:hypothetical protein
MDIFEIVFDSPGHTGSSNNIFYHMLCINDALERFDRTYKKIEYSGLINTIDSIYINCVGSNKKNLCALLSDRFKVKPIIGRNDKNESETLNLLRQFCLSQKNGNVLYLHSKGVTRAFQRGINFYSIQDWIDVMEYFLIEKYDVCLEYLKTYHSCGVNKKIQKCTRYSGNFWWCKNSFISNHVPVCKNNRLYCELGFLSNKSKKHKCLHKTSVGWPAWKHKRYPRFLYTDEPEIV